MASYPVIVGVTHALVMQARAAVYARRHRMPDGTFRPTGGRRGTVISNLFSDIAKCAVCGSSFVKRTSNFRTGKGAPRCKSRVVGKCSDNGSIPYGALERDLLKMIGTAALQKTVVLPDQADPIGEQIAKHEMELARLKRTIAKLIIEFGESDDSDDDPVMEQIRELRDNTSL